ncbi:MAG: T9SS type A sorting domain-containing protein [Flavobacteriaceae bacterium]|nr:T9SS type A sorting domain-containing protein [Flavobacteriaceae bacterium]
MNKTTLVFLLAISMFFSLQAQDKSRIIAENWLQNQSEEMKSSSTIDLQLYFRHKGPSGETLRYKQFMNGVPVFKSDIAIHVSPNNQVTYFSSTLKTDIKAINTNARMRSAEVIDLAKSHIKASGEISYQNEELVILQENGQTILAHHITLEPKGEPVGSWEVLIDAVSGEILSAEDKAVYHNHKEKDKHKNQDRKEATAPTAVMATGSGYVFDPDPLSAAGVAYGGQYVDGNDATNASLDAARSNVTLLDITFSGGNYSLVGPYAEVQDFENPNRGLFIQATNTFNFNRQQNGFEAVNVYYHVDHSMRYINETLGITLTPLVYSTGVRYDPHGLNGADNSYYLGGSNRIAFGEGCVDDAEDADVVIHELGHGIHDWITGGNLSQVNGLSEGCGDYWAQSYSRSLGQWGTGDAQYNYMFDWDGHNVCWGGRTTGYAATYPGGLVGQVHTDGQIWASVLMEIYDIIGRTKTDAAFLEGLAMTGGSTNQDQAATAVRQAAVDMVIANRYGFTCADVDVIEDRFTARGYSLSVIDCEALSLDDFDLNNVSIYPNPTNSSVYISGLTEDHMVGVYTILGQEIITQEVGINNNTIDVSTLSNGVYFIKFKNLDASHKIVKQ